MLNSFGNDEDFSDRAYFRWTAERAVRHFVERPDFGKVLTLPVSEAHAVKIVE
jgi:hypothetical protein